MAVDEKEDLNPLLKQIHPTTYFYLVKRMSQPYYYPFIGRSLEIQKIAGGYFPPSSLFLFISSLISAPLRSDFNKNGRRLLK
jgi:hypothetical protein